MSPVAPPAILVLSLVAQAVFTRVRVPIVLAAAAASATVCTLGGITTARALLAAVPWDVFILLIALGAISSMFAEAHLFERLAVLVTRFGGARPSRVALIFCVTMYVASGLVNNLTALLLVLPVLILLLRLTGTSQRHLRWTLGGLLVACNLGGAATPIGDFPAVLLLGAGAMGFVEYLTRALPMTLGALIVLLAVLGVLVRPGRDVPTTAASEEVSIAIVEALHRRVRVSPRLLVPASLSFAAMFVGWTALAGHLGPEVVAWIGTCAALLCIPRDAARTLRDSVDVDAALFLFALFVQVGAVQATGSFDVLAQRIGALALPPEGRLVAFLVTSGVLTGIFSAGPAMAALLGVAHGLAQTLPGDVVFVGLALSVCAGSSLFLTAATAGPLAQGLVERSGLLDRAGRPLRLGFFEFLPVGLLSFAIIQAAAVAWVFIGLALHRA